VQDGLPWRYVSWIVISVRKCQILTIGSLGTFEHSFKGKYFGLFYQIEHVGNKSNTLACFISNPSASLPMY